jgi:hypothetical protein
MGEPMAAHVEVWPLAADRTGIWLLSGGDAWRAGPIPADSDPLFEVQLLAGQHDPRMQLDLIHSTSWRVDGPAVILTWVGIAEADGLAVEQWPHALPVTPELYEKVGRPFTHAANEPPTPRDIDVLMHAIRHLRFLRDTDDSARAVMTQAWLDHLAAWEPALAGMYTEARRGAA